MISKQENWKEGRGKEKDSQWAHFPNCKIWYGTAMCVSVHVFVYVCTKIRL